MARRRFVYRPNDEGGVHVEEVSLDYQRTAERAPLFGDSFMDGQRAVDGTDIGSRSKRRAYMAERGLADASDFKGEWDRSAKERAAIRNGTNPDNIRQTLEAALRKQR